MVLAQGERSTMKRCYDAVVAGAGPAGSAVARDIASHGFSVLLLEEHSVIGQPLHCSGLVTPRTLALAKVGKQVVQNEIRGAIIQSPLGKQLPIGGNRVHALAIDRVLLDQAMASQAQEMGAELLLGARFLRLERDDGLVKACVERRGRCTRVLTKLLIGADGAQSNVAKQLGVHTLDRTVLGLAAEVRAKAEARDRVTVLVDKDVAPGWFAWVIPLDDGRLRIGTGTANGLKPIDSFRRLCARLPQYFRGDAVLGLAGGRIPLWSPTRLYSENVLLVGDAARQVKPTTGGGVFMGLVGATHAARVAVEALQREDFSAAFLGRYQKAFMAEAGDELRRGADLQRLFAALSNAHLEWLLARLKGERLAKLINRYGDIDFPSHLLGKLLKAAPSLAAFVRVPLGFPGAWLRRRPRQDDSPF
jgi:geranylgeranyl reductase family protein